MARLSPSSLLLGDGAKARVARGTLFTIGSYGGSQFLRLLANLLLTRLLFPEAFGLMALVQVFTIGLEMFSDTGIKASIIQSKRGHERVFLDTAWSFQIVRGLFLWCMACLLAGPAAAFYEEEMLAQLLPVATLSILITGFTSTNEATANKKIMLGRLTAINLGCQALAIVINMILAILLQSVWALVFGGLVSKVIKVILSHKMLPGGQNRLGWDRASFRELFDFGKFIMVGSIAGFLINVGDRAILGKFVTLTELAVYNIGWLLASVPMALSRLFGRRILFPLYAEKPPSESDANRRNIAKTRFIMTAAMVSMTCVMGLIGNWLVHLLYLPVYHLAGPILVLVSVASIPTMVLAAYGGLLLGVGSSRDFTTMLIATATLQTSLLYFGIQTYGLLGAIAAPGMAQLLVYPLTAWLVHRHGGWDPRHDGIFAVIALAIAALIFSIHPDAIAQVMAGSSQ